MARPIGARRVLCGTAVLAAGLMGAPSALAATFTVNSTQDAALGGAVTCVAGGTCTLRAAIQAADAAGGASTIALPGGRYALSIAPPSGTPGSSPDDPATGDLDVDGDTDVTLIGAGAGTTLINADGVDRAFAVHTGASLAISGMTIESGSPAAQSVGTQEGGAIYTDGSLSTSNVNFTANDSPSDGGAIYADSDSRLSVNGGIFTGNATEYGGAIEDLSPSPAEIANATFTRQSAWNGGGDVYFAGAGALTIADSIFTDTVGNGGGGAIYAAGSGQVTVTGSQFTDDSSSDGGAIFSNDSITLSTDTFTDDTATGASLGTGGGALYMEGAAATQMLIEDQFSGDSATAYGGALYTAGGSLGVVQSSIVGSESEDGGALYLGSDSALLEDDTIAQNSAVEGGALYLSAAAPLSLINDTIAGNTASAGRGGGIFGAASATAGSADGIVNTIIADNVGGDCDTGLGAAEVTGYDLDSDSSCLGGVSASGLQVGVQPALAAPANNGGQVLTMMEEAGSPTIGTGDGAYCPAADGRSVARNPSACDLGAYQAISTGLTATNSAPASATVGGTFAISLSATNTGPGIATNLTITDQLPAGTALAGDQSSAGSCSATGDPAKVTCDLGTVAGGTSASAVLFVSSSVAGTFTNNATVSDDQGASGSAGAQTQITDTQAMPTIARAQIRQITRTAATLRARLDPHGDAVSYFFQYGTTRQFGRVTRVTVTDVAGVRSARVVGLRPGKRYYLRLVATSGSQVSLGATYSFVTRAAKHHKPKKRRAAAKPWR